jgi:hypothetical protein
VRDVPYDPHLPCLFWGEEILLSARAWTSGYDMYNPASSVCTHQYVRVERPNVVYDRLYTNRMAEWDAQQKLSIRRVMHILGLAPTVDEGVDVDEVRTYGMGSARKLDDYLRRSGAIR